MEVAKIKEIAESLPSSNIYELLYYNDIAIMEDSDILTKKCDSMILAGNGHVGIFIKSEIHEKFKQFLLWHEYGHFIMHYEPDMKFNFYLSRYKWKTEQDANTFAFLALMKDEELSDKNILDLAIRKGVPEQIAIKVYENLVQTL